VCSFLFRAWPGLSLFFPYYLSLFFPYYLSLFFPYYIELYRELREAEEPGAAVIDKKAGMAQVPAFCTDSFL